MEHEGAFGAAEQFVQNGVEWLRLGVESIGALVIAAGIVAAIVRAANLWRRGAPRAYTALRLTLAHYLAVALEFQLAADILSTAVAPTWERIGKLASVAVIRTGLNYFLAKEMASEEAHLQQRASSDTPEELRATP
ncbi:MAG TPA: DUF1622 domain-containing protein [Longimicrobium sp.]|jgi:uncharacterized membrane protein